MTRPQRIAVTAFLSALFVPSLFLLPVWCLKSEGMKSLLWGSEFQRASIGHHGGGWGHPIDRVCRPLLGVCLGRRKDLALTTRDLRTILRTLINI